MIGVILAAGMAKRLRPLTDKCPKCLLEIGGRTLLERTVDAMRKAGITEFVVVTGYKEHMIRTFLEDYAQQQNAQSSGHLTFTFLNNADYEHNNNIYSLWMATQHLRGKEFLLMDSDILCDPKAVLEVASQPVTALALNRHDLGEEEMKIVVDSEMRITEISKTCKIEDALGESVGIEKIMSDYSVALTDELNQMICQEQLIDIFYERAFERLIPKGFTFKVVDTTQYFSYELDTPEDFEKAKELWPYK